MATSCPKHFQTRHPVAFETKLVASPFAREGKVGIIRGGEYHYFIWALD